jgi:hypothetical protein
MSDAVGGHLINLTNALNSVCRLRLSKRMRVGLAVQTMYR